MPAAVSAMLQGMFGGARAVRTVSERLRVVTSSAAYPHRYAVQRVYGELNFEAVNEAGWRFLWFEKKERRPAVVVRVRSELEPALEPLAPSPPPVTLLAVPPFLDVAGDPVSLEIAVADGRIVHVDFDEAGAITISIDGRPAEKIEPVPAFVPEGAPADTVRPMLLPGPMAWPMDAIVALLETVAEWRRGKTSARNRTFALTPGLGRDLDSLMATVIEGCERVCADVEAEAWNADGEDTMQIAVLSATVRAYLQSEEVLAGADRSTSTQQLDLVLSPGVVREDGATLLTFDLPDFLVEGALYEQFLDAVRSARDEIVAALKVPGAGLIGRNRPDAEQVDPLLEASRVPGRAAVIRVDYDDTDLVLLRGHSDGAPAGLLLEMKFSRQERGGPVVDGRRGVRLVAHLKHGTWRASRYREFAGLKAPYYFARLLRTLHALQRCVAADLGTENGR